jgi:hypothetical protein
MVAVGRKSGKQQAAGLVAGTPEVVRCPACAGRGFPTLVQAKVIDPPCQVCRGQGVIPLEICACGRCAAIVHPSLGVSYCGQDKCAEQRIGEPVQGNSADDIMYQWAGALMGDFSIN